ncbi:MAG: dTDP-glucose 4,6-dehydratase [Acidobacteriota bacterium]
MERWIITGGAGFIGSNFVRMVLADTEAEVLVFDKLTYAGSLESLTDVDGHSRYRFVRGDIAERDDVRAAIQDFRPTAIVNFAAESHVDRSIDGPGEFVRTNIGGTFELLEAARGYVAELAPEARSAFRFLHVSTDEVYGTLGPVGAFREDTPYAPNSPYAASKAAADHLVRAYFHTYGLEALVTNCSNNYGPYQFPEKLIPLMILNAAEGKALPIYGDGRQVRDWLHVEDHCRGVLLALRKGRAGEKYNLGGFGERTNLFVVDRLCDLLQEELPPEKNPLLQGGSVARYRDLKTNVQDRPGHDRRYAIDSLKAQEELGWRPTRDLDDGLRHTVRWYLDNDAWCRAVSDGRYGRQRLGLDAG